MQKSGQILLLVLLVLGLYSLTGCGGASSSLGSSIDLPANSVDGVTSGGFKAIRYNDRGYADSALNPTLNLQVAQTDGQTTVTVALADNDPMLSACVDLFYDPAQFSPVRSEFSGLIDSPLELASTRKAGIVNLGQVTLDGASLHSGQFATVTFANGPIRFAAASGDAHQIPVNRAYAPSQAGAPNQAGFSMPLSVADNANPATYVIYPFCVVGDGNADGATTLGDLTAMVFNGSFGAANTISATSWNTAPSDYNADGETGIADLTALGQRLGEATTGFDVLLKDNDGNDFSGAETPLTSFTWASVAAPARPPVSPAVLPLSLDVLFQRWDGTIDVAQATAADTNGDKSILVCAVATGVGDSSPTFSTQTMTYTGIGVTGVTITGFDVTIDAATDAVFNGAGGTATLTAGETVVLNVTGISGDYDDGQGSGAVAFTPADAGTVIPQTDYDDALTQIQAAVNWASVSAGDSATNEFRTTGPIVNLAASTGTGINGTVTTDSDPESTTASTPEGSLSAGVAASGTFLPLAINYDFIIDVTDDMAAPQFTSVGSDQAPQGSYVGLNSAGNTGMNANFTLGTAALPANLADVSLALVATYASGQTNTGELPINLTYTANPAPASGEFTLDTVLNQLQANIPAAVQQGVIYALVMSYDNGAGGTTVSSVNYPGDGFASAGTPPPPTTFSTIPNNTTLPAGTPLIGTNDVIFVTYPEPSLRRDQRCGIGGGNVTPVDPDGFNDMVKATGDGFAISSMAKTGGGFNPFPQVVVVIGNDPSVITSTTASEPVNVAFRGPNSLVLEIASLTTGGAADVTYAFKVFGGAADQANWPELGSGTFSYSPTGIAPGGPAGVDFGVNIFDSTAVTRGDLDIATRSYANKSLDGSTINTTVSDVLFVEVSNLGYYDFDLSDPFDLNQPLSSFNTQLRFIDTADSSRTLTVGVTPCVSGLGVSGDSLVAVEITSDMFSNIGIPGWPGILDPGLSFNVVLIDPTNTPGGDFTFATPLDVIGTNPN